MLPKIIFCIAVSLATLAVILLALLSPVVNRKPSKNSTRRRPWLAMSLYIQQPQVANTKMGSVSTSGSKAFIFHPTLTEGPENTSQVVGKAQGFTIPIEHFAHSAFNIIYLTFNRHGYSGTLVSGQNVAQKDKEELTMVMAQTPSLLLMG